MGRIQTLIEDPRIPGRIMGVNRRRLDEIPYWLLTDQPNNIVVVGANQSTQPQTMIVSGVGPIRITSFAVQSTGAARVFMRVQDGDKTRGLMNGGIHINAICGGGAGNGGGQPFRLPEALYLDELRVLQVQFMDLSGSTNNIRFVAHGTRFTNQQSDPTMERIRRRMESRQYLSIPYFYSFDLGPAVIGAGGTLSRVITVGQDHHFDIMTLSAVSTGLFNLDILNAQTGESLIQAPAEQHYEIGSEVLLGNGNFPLRLHEPRMVQYGQKLIVNMTDRSGAPNTVHLALGGRALAVRMWG